MPKSEFLQIRLSPADRKRIESAAKSEFLEASTWARQVLLRAVSLLDSSRENPDKGVGKSR